MASFRQQSIVLLTLYVSTPVVGMETMWQQEMLIEMIGNDDI